MAEKSKNNQIKVGHWYLCAICETCQETIPILEIQEDAAVSYDGIFAFKQVSCPSCKSKHDYPMAALRRIQADIRTPRSVQ